MQQLITTFTLSESFWLPSYLTWTMAVVSYYSTSSAFDPLLFLRLNKIVSQPYSNHSLAFNCKWDNVYSSKLCIICSLPTSEILFLILLFSHYNSVTWIFLSSLEDAKLSIAPGFYAFLPPSCLKHFSQIFAWLPLLHYLYFSSNALFSEGSVKILTDHSF